MSGHGAPETRPVDATGLRVVVVAGQWHDVITDGLIAGAEREPLLQAVADPAMREALPDLAGKAKRFGWWMGGRQLPGGIS